MTTLDQFFAFIRNGDLQQVQNSLATSPQLLNAANDRGFTPLIMATYLDQINIVKELLEKGADVNRQDAAGNTALMGVCFKGNAEIADLLIQGGATINLQNANQSTALIFASTASIPF